MDDTIFALSSGLPPAAIAVVRLSGGHAAAALAALNARLPQPRRAALRRLKDPASGDLLDSALVLWLPGPATETGEDMAELHLHGGRAVIGSVLDALARMDGLRPAEPGEFTRRAFVNGRIDLTAAEGLADLIDADTEVQRRQAVRQMEGALGDLYEGWRADLLRSLAYLEAELDFSDEGDVPGSLAGEARAGAGEVLVAITRHLADGRRGERLRDGVRVVIAGPPNAGKSTLMNALARRDVAIVSARAGTTRDVIETHLDVAGYPVILCDTAGQRVAGDDIEEEGIRRARARLGEADLVLWLAAADEADGGDEFGWQPLPGQKVARVTSKWDRVCDHPPVPALDERGLRLSVTRDWGLDALIGWIGAAAADLCAPGEGAAMTRARHRAALEECRAALERFLAAAEAGAAGELQAEDLRLAARALGRITGRVDVEDLLDIVFADFCIGK